MQWSVTCRSMTCAHSPLSMPRMPGPCATRADLAISDGGSLHGASRRAWKCVREWERQGRPHVAEHRDRRPRGGAGGQLEALRFPRPLLDVEAQRPLLSVALCPSAAALHTPTHPPGGNGLPLGRGITPTLPRPRSHAPVDSAAHCRSQCQRARSRRIQDCLRSARCYRRVSAYRSLVLRRPAHRRGRGGCHRIGPWRRARDAAAVRVGGCVRRSS